MTFTEKKKKVEQQLSKWNKLKVDSATTEDQLDRLSHALLDFEESSIELNSIISRLYNENLTPSEVDDLIVDIGEELRHILYHIRDSKAYDYLL